MPRPITAARGCLLLILAQQLDLGVVEASRQAAALQSGMHRQRRLLAAPGKRELPSAASCALASLHALIGTQYVVSSGSANVNRATPETLVPAGGKARISCAHDPNSGTLGWATCEPAPLQGAAAGATWSVDVAGLKLSHCLSALPESPSPSLFPSPEPSPSPSPDPSPSPSPLESPSPTPEESPSPSPSPEESPSPSPLPSPSPSPEESPSPSPEPSPSPSPEESPSPSPLPAKRAYITTDYSFAVPGGRAVNYAIAVCKDAYNLTGCAQRDAEGWLWSPTDIAFVTDPVSGQSMALIVNFMDKTAPWGSQACDGYPAQVPCWPPVVMCNNTADLTDCRGLGRGDTLAEILVTNGLKQAFSITTDGADTVYIVEGDKNLNSGVVACKATVGVGLSDCSRVTPKEAIQKNIKRFVAYRAPAPALGLPAAALLVVSQWTRELAVCTPAPAYGDAMVITAANWAYYDETQITGMMADPMGVGVHDGNLYLSSGVGSTTNALGTLSVCSLTDLSLTGCRAVTAAAAAAAVRLNAPRGVSFHQGSVFIANLVQSESTGIGYVLRCPDALLAADFASNNCVELDVENLANGAEHVVFF